MNITGVTREEVLNKCEPLEKMMLVLSGFNNTFVFVLL